MKTKELAKWARSAAKASNLSQAEIGRQMTHILARSVDRAAVNKMLNDSRRIAVDEMVAISKITSYPLPVGADIISATEQTGFDDLSRPHTARPRDGILEIDIRGGLGGGGVAEGDVRHDGQYADPVKEEAWHFPARFMREEIRAPQDRVIVMETIGDSMAPTIFSGDRVIIDTGHRLPSPDGIYAMRDRFGTIVVKRLHLLRHGDSPRIKVISDNPHHPEEEIGADELEIVGRVLWSLKRL